MPFHADLRLATLDLQWEGRNYKSYVGIGALHK